MRRGRSADPSSSLHISRPANYYAVRRGRQTGIFASWSACGPLVTGFPGARYKKFETRKHAEAFVAGISPPRLPRPASARTPVATKLVAQRQSTACALAKLPRGSLLLYTDGGCTGNQGVASTIQPAGWGVVVLKNEREADSHEAGGKRWLAELYGPVELCQSSPWFIGAEVASNNTGELSGIAHALIWLRDEGGQAAAAIVYDSDYAAKIAQGIYKAHKNRALAKSCRRLCTAERQRRAGGVTFIHVKGHSNDRWNDRADALVQLGKLGQRSSGLGVLGPALSPRSHKRTNSGDDQHTEGKLQVRKKQQRVTGVAVEKIDLT